MKLDVGDSVLPYEFRVRGGESGVDWLGCMGEAPEFGGKRVCIRSSDAVDEIGSAM